jgi:CheY-like chemotaxis protein
MKPTVLVVEDKQDTAEPLKCVLERTDSWVTHAKAGRQATTLIKTTRAPSLVFLDSGESRTRRTSVHHRLRSNQRKKRAA